MKPNLFQHIQNASSQAAFLCWLLSWAKEEYKDRYPKLFKRGRAFFDLIAKKEPQLKNIKIEALEIRQNYKTFDYLILINDCVKIILEAHLKAKYWKDSLDKYDKKIDKELEGYIAAKISCSADFILKKEKEIASAFNFKTIDFLEIDSILEAGSGNDIYENYLTFIRTKAIKYNSFRSIPYKNWNLDQYLGFYYAITQKIEYDYARFSQNSIYVDFKVSRKDNVLKYDCSLTLDIESEGLLIAAYFFDPKLCEHKFKKKLLQFLTEKFNAFEFIVTEEVVSNQFLKLSFKNFPVINQITKKVAFIKSLGFLSSLKNTFESIEALAPLDEKQ